MCRETKITNLYHANSVNTDDNDFSKGKILDGVRYGLRDYIKYIEKSIKVVQEEGAIKVSVRKIFFDKKTGKEISDIKQKNTEPEIRYYVETDKLGEKKSNKIDSELFEREIKTVFSEKPNGNRNENKSLEIKIRNRKAEDKYLILDTNEDIQYFYLKANDYQLKMQKRAVENLMFQPKKEHTPLQKLFDLSRKTETYFENNIEQLQYEPNWKILTEPEKYNGTDEQQDFVRKALRTKDFALLEGPPGSGKTTAIIELIIQLIKQDKRVLLVSATHVAVDNVIHRILTTYKSECEGLVVPIRISSDKGSIRKESVEPYRLQTFIKNTKNKIRSKLSANLKIKSKQILHDSLKKDDRAFDDIILKSANLVGGTMIGILQHPGIRKDGIQEMFDVMIVDESSKVTFLDFIVPALYAKKWILVGDVNQLSPYTEDDFINDNIDAVLEDNTKKQDLVKSFEVKRILNSEKYFDKESLKIFFSDTHTEDDFLEYEVFEVDNYFTPTKENVLKLNSVDIIICKPINKCREIISNYVYVKSMTFEGNIEQINFQNRQKAFHKNKGRNKNIKIYPFEFKNDKNQEWKEMVGSRLSQMYQYRFEPDLNKQIKQEYDFLVPEGIHGDVENIRKIALPSILEMLQIGIGETKRTTREGETYKEEKLIYEGFNQFPIITQQKFQSLSFQHRMHDEIASISREYFYNENNNLKTANTVFDRKDVLDFYKPNENKVIWVTNQDSTFRKKRNRKQQENINPTEVKHIRQELENFIKEAKFSPKSNNKDYEIAVITFYRGQEQKLKNMLKSLTNQKRKSKYFKINNVKITLSTVDKFQGDESDMVLLSFTKFTKKAFYNSPNRLNVALTRAKYKLILFGNKNWLEKNAQLKALRKLAGKFNSRISTN